MDEIPDYLDVSIHASHAGGDDGGSGASHRTNRFNPRLPCGRRRAEIINSSRSGMVSIHASHAGGDAGLARSSDCQDCFNPRLPCGRRRCAAHIRQRFIVSIHASHAGGDHNPPAHVQDARSFNPRLPCGRRPPITSRDKTSLMFQSTPPMREATRRMGSSIGILIVSIHASHAGGDVFMRRVWLC